MKYKLIVVFLLLTSFAYSYDLRISDNAFRSISRIYSISTKDNMVAVLGPVGFYDAVVYLYNGIEWKELNNVIKTDTGNCILTIDGYSKIVFDSNNDLWINGMGSIYHYSNNEWNEFKIKDSLESIRKYRLMCIDNDDNVWVATSAHINTPRFMKSEIFKFDGQSFNEIYNVNNSVAFITSYEMQSSPNGSIFLAKNLTTDDTAVQDKNLYIIKPDLTIEKVLLVSPDSVFYNKAVSQIYVENDNKIWFCFDEKEYYLNGLDNPPSYSSSGLSLYENQSWYLFNEKNGFEKTSRGNYPPILGIVKTDFGKYWAFGKNYMYTFDDSYNVDRISWKDIIENSEFICVYNYDYDKAYTYLEETVNETNTGTPEYRRMVKTSDGTIWISFVRGLLKVNPSFRSVQNFQENNESLIIYPNPASSELNISVENYKKVEIYDMMGKLVFSQNTAISQIDVSSLSQGTYYLKLYFQNNSIKNLMFIKK